MRVRGLLLSRRPSTLGGREVRLDFEGRCDVDKLSVVNKRF